MDSIKPAELVNNLRAATATNRAAGGGHSPGRQRLLGFPGNAMVGHAPAIRFTAGFAAASPEPARA